MARKEATLPTMPDELLSEIAALLDYGSIARLAQTCKAFSALTRDAFLWKRIYHSTFEPAIQRDCACEGDNGAEYAARAQQGQTDRDKLMARLGALQAFLKNDTDIHAPTLLSIFYEMGERNAAFIDRQVAIVSKGYRWPQAEELARRYELLCGGMAWQLARNHALENDVHFPNKLGRQANEGWTIDDAITEVMAFRPGDGYVGRGRRQDLDPRSDIYLARILFARQQGLRASSMFVKELGSWTSSFLKAASMIIYDSVSYPLYHFPPQFIRSRAPAPDEGPIRATAHARAERIAARQRAAAAAGITHGNGPCINWGVVETILQMVGIYKNGLPELIPGLSASRDCIEYDIPMEACMFDGRLAGRYRGVYAYLDYRELEQLDFGRPLAPDYFDGISELVIEEEEEVETFRPSGPDADIGDQEADHGSSESLDGNSSNGSDDAGAGTDEDDDEFWADDDYSDHLHNIPFRRFTANSRSRYHMHRHHIHGSSMQIPGYPPGFKIVRFESMFDEDNGLLPWIVEAVSIPSVGIVGRWRDRSEHRGIAVQGPYFLSRDRVGDYLAREKMKIAGPNAGPNVDTGSEAAVPIRETTTSETQRSERYIVVEASQVHG